MNDLSPLLHEHPKHVAIGAGAAAGLVVARLLFAAFWSKKEELYRAITYFFQPNFWSFLTDDLEEDREKIFRLFAYVALCGVAGYLVYRCVHFELLGLPSVIRNS